MSELQHMAQSENTDMVPPPGAMEEGKESMVQEVAKIVKSFYNRDNPAVGPFRGEEGIVIDVEKQISEKFGEDAGQQAGKMAEAFMQKLTQEWQQKHGDVANGHGDDGLARLKELLGHVKSKVEGIGPDKEDPPFDPDPPRDGERKDQFGNPIKHVAKHLAKQGMKQAQGDDGLSRLKELLDNVKAKVEGIGDQGQGGRDFNKNIMSAENNDDKDWHPSKHITDPQKKKELSKYDTDVKRGSYDDRARYMKAGGVPDDRGPNENGPDKSEIPAYRRKEQGGDWKMSTKDLEKEKTNSPTSSAGLARKKTELGISEELTAIMKLSGLAK
jgi:hypothetical protein